MLHTKHPVQCVPSAINHNLSTAVEDPKAETREGGRPRGNTDGTKTLSPLRYPGAKRQLIPLIRSLLVDFSTPPRTLVEPFAGGASVGIQLLADGVIESLVINDLDDWIYSFWYVAAFDSQWLIEAMWELEINLAQWERMRAWSPTSIRDKALKCLYLNRTSFSGILNSKAGPIGGKKQKSKYSIDCRFSRSTIQHRLSQVAALAASGAIHAVWNYDWKDCISKGLLERPRDSGLPTFYLDPPFYAKAIDLYRHSFCEEEHLQLASYLQTLNASWILSYDDHPRVRSLYQSESFPERQIGRLLADYRAASKSRKVTELIVTSLNARM